MKTAKKVSIQGPLFESSTFLTKKDCRKKRKMNFHVKNAIFYYY